MKEYIVSLILTALICGLIPNLLTKGTAQALTKMACGLVLVIAVIGPLRNFDWRDWERALSFQDDGGEYTAQGEALAQNAMGNIIKAETEAYILDKAAELGAEIFPEVILSADAASLPEAVIIRGEVPSEIQEQLREIICTQLGIAKENLTWIGET